MDITSLSILTDENIASTVVAYLRSNGINVVDVKEEHWFGKPDRFLLEKSVREKRFVLSHDSDFGTLVINQGQQFYGIIYLRVRNQQPQHVINVLERLFRLNISIKPETMIVVKEKTEDNDLFVRVRHHKYSGE